MQSNVVDITVGLAHPEDAKLEGVYGLSRATIEKQKVRDSARRVNRCLSLFLATS